MRPSLSPLGTRRRSESPFFRSLFWAGYGERRQRAAPFRSSRTSAWTLVAAAVSFMLQRAWIWRTGQSFAQARLYPRVCARPRSDFAWTPSDGSTRFAMSGVRSRVFLPCPPDAYAEPPGWLVWSLRSGRMAARVIYGLDNVVAPKAAAVAKLSVQGHTRVAT